MMELLAEGYQLMNNESGAIEKVSESDLRGYLVVEIHRMRSYIKRYSNLKTNCYEFDTECCSFDFLVGMKVKLDVVCRAISEVSGVNHDK